MTAIYSLETGSYGPSDFRELLTNLLNNEVTKRPAKVEQHLWKLAHDIGKIQRDDDPQDERVQQELDELEWRQENGWEIGYSSANNEIIACRLKKCLLD